MKTKLYRVLVLLLAIAMMIPSFALAEDPAPTTPTLTIVGTKEVSINYTGNTSPSLSDTKWTVAGMPDTWEEALIEWEITPADYFKFSNSGNNVTTSTVIAGQLEEQSIPGLSLYDLDNAFRGNADLKEAKCTITGKLIVDTVEKSTASFTVTVKKVDVTAIAFTEQAVKDYATWIAGDGPEYLNPSQIIKLTPEGGAGTSFNASQVQFNVIEGGRYAKVNSSKNLIISSDTPTDTVIKVKAWIPGSTAASYSASTAVLTIKVVGHYEPTDPTVPTKGYEYLGFTVEKETGNVYTIVDPLVSETMSNYLTKIPYDVPGDQLIWDIDDPTVADITQSGVVTFKDPKKNASVKITVTSHNNPKATDSCVLSYVAEKPAEVKTSKINGFIPTDTITIAEYNGWNELNLLKRLDYEKGKGDSLIWQNQNGLTITNGIIEDYSMLTADISPVKVTVRSMYDYTQTATITINIKKAEEEEPTYSTVAFDSSAVDVITDSDTIEGGECVYDASKHLVIEPGKDLKLQWTVAPATLATVNKDGKVTFTKVAKDGDSVTVSVRNTKAKEAVEATMALKLVVKEDESTSYTKIDFAPATADALYEKPVEGEYGKFDLDPYLVLQGKGDEEDLVWSVNDPTIATVNDGVVTMLKPGTVTITMSYKKLAPATFTLNIKKIEKPYTKIELKSATAVKVVLDKNNTINLNGFISTEGNELDQDKLVWTSKNQQVLKFKEANKYKGKATTVKAGTSKVTVYNVGDPTVSLTFDVEVLEDEGKVASLAILDGYKELTFETGAGDIYLDRFVMVTPKDATDKTVYPTNADTLIFTSNDTDILKVDEATGKVDLSSGKPGTAVITVRSKKNPDAQAQFTITHAKAELKNMKFVDAPKTLSRKGSVDLKNYLVTDPWYYTDKTYATTDLYWESSDPQIATVGEKTGIVTWKGVGKVTITVTEINSKKTATHEIELTDPSAVQEVILKDITLTAGDNVKLSDFMTLNPLDAEYKDVKFTSSDRNVAEILGFESTAADSEATRIAVQSAYLKAYRGGESTITVYIENYDKSVKTATCKVTVIGNNDVEDVKIAKNKYALKLNTKTSVVVRFNAEPYNCDIDKDDIYVVSSNSAIADTDANGITVNSKGRKGYFTVYAKKPGTVWFTIKRTKDDKELDACKIIISAVRVKSVKWEKDTVKLYWYNDGITDYYDGTQSNTVYKNYVDIKPIINPANAYCNVTFETTDPGVAFVDSKSIKGFQNALASGSGLSDVKITAVGPGKCKIIMKVDDGKKVRKATLNVEVETKLPKLKISQRTATLKLEKGSDILYLRAFDAYTDKDIEVKWTSSDTSVAKVNVDGKVRAVGAGKATITATTKNGQKQVVKCKITVKAPSTENVAAKKITGDTKVTVKAGEKKALEIKVKPEGAKVTFTSSDSKIVKVTKDGTIKGIKAGKATITVKAAEGKAELKIKVVVK